MTYEDIRPGLDSGDLVLFGGTSQISAVIKRLTGSPWSHVGMILRDAVNDLVLLWESTSLSALPDLDTGLARRGVQVVELSERIRTYQGDIAVRPLQCERTPMFRARLAETRREFRGRPYEQNYLELALAAYDGPLGKQRAANVLSLFCSELVAAALQRAGVLTRPAEGGLPSNEYVPGDCASGQLLERHLVQGARLDREIYITGRAA